ncbi:c75b499d-e65b-4e7d-9dea-e209e5e3fc8a [Sclerotinia trifoliorum]|uniref:C75b499d-e65b-4e7d-9dea-e209e5e3fc8a n=1 Tax=Sclerotinia trifoliorum TaxID=28548 RepID=A0A8H2VX72_9HELO|nr:c75b499d-e65b-4e7d-9dea-e209e5e3fc8a [Sclerotinia trifoliorum]
MNNLRQHPNKVPEFLYIVHNPSNDQNRGVVSQKSDESYSPCDIGFRPYDVRTLGFETASSYLPSHYGVENEIPRNLPSIYVTATDDIEAARNQVITSEEELVMYRLNGRCDEMRRCVVFKASNWLQDLDLWEGDADEDEEGKYERQKKLGSEWLIWPSVPKEAIINISGKEAIMMETEKEHESFANYQGQKRRKASAGPSRDLEVATTAKRSKSSSKSSARNEEGFLCKELDSDGTPQYMANFPDKKTFQFSAIHVIEPREDGAQCLIHWGPSTDPSWISIGDVDARAVKEFRKRQIRAESRQEPKKGDPFEILFEEPLNKETKLNSRFLVRWTDTGRITWETYGGSPGVTRHASNRFLAERKKWKRYQYT